MEMEVEVAMGVSAVAETKILSVLASTLRSLVSVPAAWLSMSDEPASAGD